MLPFAHTLWRLSQDHRVVGAVEEKETGVIVGGTRLKWFADDMDLVTTDEEEANENAYRLNEHRDWD